MDLSSFQHSLFLSALGNAILNSFWQGFLLWLVYETVVITYKKINANIRHNLSVLCILCSFIWFFSTFISNFMITEKLSVLVQQPIIFETPEKGKSSFFGFFLSYTNDILPYLSIAYMMLLVFLMAKLYASYRHVHFVSHKNLIRPASQLLEFSEKVAGKLGISRKIKIWVSNHIEVPATIGFLKPVILIPFASINSLTALQLEAIILHELSHIKRNDYLVNLLVSIIETILFFNPFVARFIKIIKTERENCCDDFVLQYQYDPHSYASALLRLEQSRKNNLQLALGAVSGKKQLLLRVKRIMGNNTATQFNYGQKLLALIITTGIFCSLAWLSPAKPNKETGKAAVQVPGKSIIKTDPLSLNYDNAVNENETVLNKSAGKKMLSKTKNHQAETVDVNADIGRADVINEDKNANRFDQNFDNQMPDHSDPLHALHQSKSDWVRDGNLRKINGLDFKKLNVTISKGLAQAYTEIDKIPWSEVQQDIEKSFAKININDLTGMQKEAILNARKYMSVINLEKVENSSKLLREIQNQQRLIQDSLRAAGTTLTNMRPAKLALKISKVNAAHENPQFTFDYEVQAQTKSLRKNNNSSNTQFLQLNGPSVLFDAVRPPTQNGSEKKRTIKRTTHRAILDI